MFKDRLRELRIKNGLTQEELAKMIHVSRSAICKWEMGNGIPSEPNIEGLCDFFNVTEEWLLDRKDLINFINRENELKIKILITSITSIIISLLLTVFTFIGIFKQINNEPNFSIIQLYLQPKSIFDFLGFVVIIPIILYAITITISFFNIVQFIKEELRKKFLIYNIILLSISILFYIMSFIIATILANEKGFGIIL